MLRTSVRARPPARRRISGLVVAALAAMIGLVYAAPAHAAAIGCQVSYVKQSEWPGGVSAQLTLTNAGTTAWTAWSLTFHFPDAGQHIGNAWSANWSQSGTLVTATNMSWNGNVAPGGTPGTGSNGT